jgi:putative MATE family efflux protein
MSAFVKDKGFYKQLSLIAVPIALQNLISFGMNMTDTVMLGRLGEKQISASALANQPYYIFTIFMFGLASGACVLTAQYWGKGDRATINRILALALKASVLCALLFTLCVLIFPEQVMGLYTADREVIRLGAQFLRIIGASYVITAVSGTYLLILRSIENVKLPLLINFSSFVVNVFLNWVFIFGNLGSPAMGIRGSALATLCARILELAMALTYAYAFDRVLRFRLRELFRMDFGLLHDFMLYSAPVVINETLWAVGSSCQSVIIGHLGSEQVAASSIGGVVQKLATVVIFGVANAAAVIVGKQIGAGDRKKAMEYARTILALSVLIGLLSSGVVALLKHPTMLFYNVGAVTTGYTYDILDVYTVIVFFVSFNAINIIGILRGGGDTRFAMVLDVACMWTVALPLGALAGLYLHLPFRVVFFLLLIDEPVKFFIGLWRFRSRRWLRDVTRPQTSESA